MHAVLLVNPTARAGAGAAAADRAAQGLRDAGVHLAVTRPSSPAAMADAAMAARDDGADAVLVAGGDGTVSLVARVLARSGVPLGILPTGTGNDLARALGVGDVDAAVAAIATRRTRDVDMAEVTRPDGTTALFTTILASGFDARVNDRANRMRWPRGHARYTIALLEEFLRLRSLPFRLELELADGTARVVEDDLVIAAVGNTACYGGGVPICPDADVDDGLLDVTVARAAGRLRLLSLLPRVYAGRHLSAPEVSSHRVRAVTLTSPGVTAWADGEPLGALPLRVAAAPGALRVFRAQ